MKSKLMTFLKISLAFLLFFAVLQTNNTNVNAETLETVNTEILKTESIQIQATSAANAKIWFKGFVVGTLSLGTFVYVTGKPPEEWVVWGIEKTEKKIKNFAASSSYTPGKPIYVASNGNINSCVVFPCAVATSIDLEDQ